MLAVPEIGGSQMQHLLAQGGQGSLKYPVGARHKQAKTRVSKGGSIHARPKREGDAIGSHLQKTHAVTHGLRPFLGSLGYQDSIGLQGHRHLGLDPGDRPILI